MARSTSSRSRRKPATETSTRRRSSIRDFASTSARPPSRPSPASATPADPAAFASCDVRRPALTCARPRSLRAQPARHPGGPVKILVVDDHPLIQQALAAALPQLDGGIEVLAALDREDTHAMLARHPDCALVLLDLALPGAHGFDLLAELVRDYRRMPVVVLSATHDRATVSTALAAGARGYVAKTSTPGELLDAIRTVLGGG